MNSNYQDRELTCKECGSAFVFTAGEQEYYASRGFEHPPGRCPQCRSARMAMARQAEAEYSGGSSSYSGGPRMGVDRATLAWWMSRALDPPVEPSEAAIDSSQRAIAAVAEGRLDEVIAGEKTAAQVVADMRLGDFVFPNGLWAVCRLDSRDYEPYGQLDRSHWGGDCSAGCRWFCELEGRWRLDWGVCANPRSHRAGLLTFEHQGCPEFEPGEDASPADFGPGASE